MEDCVLAKKYEKILKTFAARACLKALVPIKNLHNIIDLQSI
jgi:hypothetical protein